MRDVATAIHAARGFGADVIVVGTLDTPESCQAALVAATSGALVIAALRATSLASAVATIVAAHPESQHASARQMLSGTLAGGETIANRTLIADSKLGKGHVVMFALRPFWRWQSQGSYFLAFNAILNWNHLDAGMDSAGAAQAAPTAGQR